MVRKWYKGAQVHKNEAHGTDQFYQMQVTFHGSCNNEHGKNCKFNSLIASSLEHG